MAVVDNDSGPCEELRLHHFYRHDRVRSGEMPGSLVRKPPCVAERRGVKRGGMTGRSAALSEACGVVNVHRSFGRSRRSRARVNRAKATERVFGPGAGAEEPPGV